MSNTVLNKDRWKEYEPFDRSGLKEWTDVFDGDENGCENRVAVYDPYGTCQLVLCAEHNGGKRGPARLTFPSRIRMTTIPKKMRNTGREDTRKIKNWIVKSNGITGVTVSAGKQLRSGPVSFLVSV